MLSNEVHYEPFLKEYKDTTSQSLNSYFYKASLNDLSYSFYLFRTRVIQYLIRKLLDMVKMGIEGLAVAALLISVKASQKLKIYYINRALSKLNCYALYS